MAMTMSIEGEVVKDVTVRSRTRGDGALTA